MTVPEFVIIECIVIQPISAHYPTVEVTQKKKKKHSASPATAMHLHSAGQATMALLVTPPPYQSDTSNHACQTTALVRHFVAILVRLTCLADQTSKATGWGAGWQAESFILPIAGISRSTQA